MDDTYVQQAILLKVFPEFRHQSKEDRELQLKVINEKFDVVDWYQGIGNDSAPAPDPNHMRQYPFEFYDWHDKSWFVVRFSGIKLRARLVHKVPDIYCAIIQSSTVPQLLFYNEMIPKDRWENDETCDGERFEHAWHPHISGSEPCTGAHSRHFSRTASDGSIIGFLAAIRNFLSSWNNNSRFWNLNSYRAFTGDYARKVLITAWDMSYIRSNVGRNSNDMSQSMDFQYQTIPRLYTHLVNEQGAFPKEACMITRMLSRSLASSDHRTVSERLVTGTEYHDDYVLLNEWYNNGWKHRHELFNEKANNTMRDIYYNYQDFLWEKFPSFINREVNNQMVIGNDDLGDFALMAYRMWMEEGGYRHYRNGDMKIRPIEKTFREFFGMRVEFNFKDIYEALNPEGLYGDLWGHELVMKLNREAKLECCLSAYERFGKKQREIANEINTLQNNSTENRVFQQILQF